MEEIDLKEFLKYLRKYIWMMLAAMVVFVSAISIYDLAIKTPLYKSDTTVLLNRNTETKTSAAEDLTTLNYNQKMISTYSELVKSSNVLERAAKQLEMEEGAGSTLAGKISVSSVKDTEIMKISAEDADPEQAAAISRAVANALAEAVFEKYDSDDVKVWDEAKVSNKVSNNTLMRDILIATFVGVFGVVAIAFLIFYFDDTVKYNKNLEKELGVPIIGKITRSEIANKKDANVSELVVATMPKASASETIRNLRTNLSFSAVDKGLKTLLITSTNAAEGKSFVSSNLATAYAQAGYKVLLVDCDLRKGRLHRIFRLKNRNGFSNLLIDDNYKDTEKYIKETEIEQLSVITRGTCPPNPSELLGSERAKSVAEYLSKNYDIVIFDGAPCSGLSDSIVASRMMDKVLLVCSDGKTNRSDLMTVYEDLKKVSAPLAGVVMNNIKRKDAGYYNYYEKDIYKHRDENFEAAMKEKAEKVVRRSATSVANASDASSASGDAETKMSTVSKVAKSGSKKTTRTRSTKAKKATASATSSEA